MPAVDNSSGAGNFGKAGYVLVGYAEEVEYLIHGNALWMGNTEPDKQAKFSEWQVTVSNTVL